MKSLLKPVLAAAVLLFVGRAAASAPSRDELVARGRYLVENVGLCADCHSPRNERGQFIAGKEYSGSPLAFAPTVPMPAWGAVAPSIAGLPTLSEADAVTFLQTGVRPDGSRPRPPMPEFRFSADDAAAVAAFLKSFPH
jgi:mono/diheme cytochrome c family protein